MEELNKQETRQVLGLKKKLNTSRGFMNLAWIFFAGGILFEGINLLTANSSLSSGLYFQMGVEQKILVTLDSINSRLFSLGFVIIAIFFVLLSIYYKDK